MRVAYFIFIYEVGKMACDTLEIMRIQIPSM
jgi:hypothetical protein